MSPAAGVMAAGELARAARLFGAAEALHDFSGIRQGAMERANRDRCVVKLRELLDAETLEREWARGRAMTLSDAVEDALGTSDTAADMD